MADDLPFDARIWQAFLQQHHLGHHEQADFLAYLREHSPLPIESVHDLEEEYLAYLQDGDSGVV